MDVFLWALTGGLAGWVGFKYVGANAERGMLASLAIGVIGGFFGGFLLAPMLGETATMTDAFNPGTLLVAIASAAACLTISDMVWRRFAI